MLEASENIAISVEEYTNLLEESKDLDEIIKAIMDNVSLSWGKSHLVLDIESSRDLMTLIRIKYPETYRKKFNELTKKGVDDDA